MLRSDSGTENLVVENIQTALRYHHNDVMAQRAFLYGKSTHNQVSQSIRSVCVDH